MNDRAETDPNLSSVRPVPPGVARPFWSVVVPTSFTDFEFVIIDDGSTDGSGEILERYAARDRRIRLVRRENCSIGASRNEALALSRGEFLAVMDSDDVSLPQHLDRQVVYLHACPECVAVGSRVLFVDPEDCPIHEVGHETTHEEIDAAHLRGESWPSVHLSLMMRRQVVEEVGDYRLGYLIFEDLDLFLGLAEHGRLANLPEVLLRYRQHVASTCHTQPRERVCALLTDLYLEAYRRQGLDPESLDLRFGDPEESPYLRHREWAWSALKAGYPKTARKHALKALRLAPFREGSWRLLYCALRGH